jgi:hypothetical protein
VGRNDDKLSAEMKAAVVAAREDGMAPAEVVKHAAAGRFDGLPPFTIAESTIRRLVQFKRSRDWVAAGNGGSDHDDDAPEPDRLRAIAESTIARVENLEKPTARDLSAAQQAQRVLDDADRRAARRGRPAMPAPSKPSPLLDRLVKEANDYLAAVDAGLRCECPEPDLAGYGYRDHAPICRHCHRPARETPQSRDSAV